MSQSKRECKLERTHHIFIISFLVLSPSVEKNKFIFFWILFCAFSFSSVSIYSFILPFTKHLLKSLKSYRHALDIEETIGEKKFLSRRIFSSVEQFVYLFYFCFSISNSFFLFKNLFLFIDVQLIYSIVLVSGVQKSDSVIHTFIYPSSFDATYFDF